GEEIIQRYCWQLLAAGDKQLSEEVDQRHTKDNSRQLGQGVELGVDLPLLQPKRRVPRSAPALAQVVLRPPLGFPLLAHQLCQLSSVVDGLVHAHTVAKSARKGCAVPEVAHCHHWRR